MISIFCAIIFFILTYFYFRSHDCDYYKHESEYYHNLCLRQADIIMELKTKEKTQ